MMKPVSLLVLLLTFSAQAFDWNDKTVLHVLDLGKMKIESGHPLATHRSFLIATDPNKVGDETLRAMQKVFGESLAQLRSESSDAMQSVLFGNWLNEIITNLDLNAGAEKEGKGALHSKALDLASVLMHRRYRRYLDFVHTNPNSQGHSPRFSQSTGYTSTNYLHSMMITSEAQDGRDQPTQDEVVELILRYSYYSILSAIAGLAETTLAMEKGLLSRANLQDDRRYINALTSIGSVFHLVQDSAVACTPRARKFIPCIPGDGHGIVAEIDGEPKVVSLSDHVYYRRPHNESEFGGHTPHAALDKLYNRRQVEAAFGELDPALSGAGILAGVARAAERLAEMAAGDVVFDDDGLLSSEQQEKLNKRVFREASLITHNYVIKRYAVQGERKPLPPLPGSHAH